MKPPRFVAYLRVSTDEQARSGAGLADQLSQCGTLAERHGSRVVASRTDDGVSGASPLAKRPGLLEAIALLGPGDVLAVARRDRIGRDPDVVRLIEMTVAACGARVLSAAGEGTEDDSASSIMVRRFMDAVSENVRLVIKERTRGALLSRKLAGRRTGQLPYGLALDTAPGGPTTKSGGVSRVVPHAADLAALDHLRRWEKLGMSIRGMCDSLNSLGIPTKCPGRKGSSKVGRGPSTGLWSPCTVHRLVARIRSEDASKSPDVSDPLVSAD